MNGETLKVFQCINKHFIMYGGGCTPEEISVLTKKPVVDVLVETTRLKIDKKIEYKWNELRNRSLFYPLENGV